MGARSARERLAARSGLPERALVRWVLHVPELQVEEFARFLERDDLEQSLDVEYIHEVTFRSPESYITDSTFGTHVEVLDAALKADLVITECRQ